jgi:ketosteroid isomerase-like protein
MKRSLLFVAVVIFMAISISCQCQQEEAVQLDLAAQETAVKEVMGRFWQSFQTGDINLLSEVTAGDSDLVMIGTDAAERWIGYEAFKMAMEQQFSATESVQTSLSDEIYKIHHSGEVAWYSAVVGFKGVSQGQDFEFAGIRATAVLERRDSGWVVVQYHGSAPVAGQLVEY